MLYFGERTLGDCTQKVITLQGEEQTMQPSILDPPFVISVDEYENIGRLIGKKLVSKRYLTPSKTSCLDKQSSLKMAAIAVLVSGQTKWLHLVILYFPLYGDCG